MTDLKQQQQLVKLGIRGEFSQPHKGPTIWVVQLVNCLTLGISLGVDARVVSSSLMLSSTPGMEHT